MKIIKWILVLAVIVGCQNQIPPYQGLQDNASRSFYLYPSTLRMVNIEKDTAFYEMVSGINQLYVFLLNDSDKNISKSKLDSITTEWSQNGYEEYMYSHGGDLWMRVHGNDQQASPELMGVLSMNEQTFGFYLDGSFNIAQIPAAMNAIQGNQLLDMFNLTSQSNSPVEPVIESDTITNGTANP